ncbi:Fe-S-cluster-containing hydrogenase [Geomonas silvestris]|uniref:Fe-S-cluster-containing hydrogenase n=1 Tax=Geomonas silvestris TaxID=2740184 RepID=A0A6V8MFU6_9BACT|nr:molybdopterin dinucleotide binding domain-containing protein [Geomonas silvestris]GFO58880.1 Fe-S-cluster-containing hydrogenase [Geomonas silvestris]
MPDISRRTFLWLTGGSSIAIATNPPRKMVIKLIPHVTPLENVRPGSWQLYATTCRECPAGCGMHVWHRDGRVTKAEGNPEHPVNRGGLCPRGQASLQGLYDPDRMQRVLYREKGRPEQQQSWEEAFAAISARLAAGGRVAVLSSLQSGALAEVLHGFAAAFGSDRVLFYEAFNHEPVKAAHQQLFGRPVVPTYHLEQCDLIVSFAADFLESWISPVTFARALADGRTYRGGTSLSRMVYVGPRLSMTAANADQYLQVPPGWERVVAATMLKIMLDQGWARQDISWARPAIEALVAEAGPVPWIPQDTLVQLTREFCTSHASVALSGPLAATSQLATDTALLVALLNYGAGRIGQTVDLSRPHALSASAREAELELFFASLDRNDLLFIYDTNPAYSRFGAKAQLAKAGLVVYLGTQVDETAELAHWFLPVDYPLEAWGDYEPNPGIHSLLQPTLSRLYDTRAPGDIFLELARRTGRPLSRAGSGNSGANFATWVRERFSSLVGHDTWDAALAAGGDWKSAAVPSHTPVPVARPAALSFAPLPQRSRNADQAELVLWSSIMLYDGRLANRGWLQEAPDPLTFFLWGNWIDLHPKQAAALGISEGDLVELSSAAGKLRAPARVTAEVSEGAVAVAMGQGHWALGRNARGIGANAFALTGGRTDGSLFGSCRIRKVASASPETLIPTALSQDQHQREILKWVPLSKLSAMQPGEGEPLILPLPEGYRPDKDMYPKREYTTHRWAMVIDLQRCIGCGACSVACYAENNIPVVGRQRVADGREMAWLRVAPYRKSDQPGRASWLPLLCQHCDAAPCEPVCPVFAAMHNEEGLNAQIYNRCIGTRYCSNNCPYKVRRFNWVNIRWQAPLDLQLNPEVTVRSRGVMEKCTFCVQRIRLAEYQAQREGRKIKDGEIQPACAQSCPARVFTFGDLLDPDARVTLLTRLDPRRYHLLEDLNTKPAVTFLRRIENDVKG